MHCTLSREEEVEKTECPWALGRDLLLTSARHPGLQKRTPRAPQDRGSDMWVWQPGPFGCRTASEVTCGVFPLGETEGFIALNVVVIFTALELTGANSHKGNSIAVGLIHIRLNFENKGGEIIIEGIDYIALCHSGKGRGSHL